MTAWLDWFWARLYQHRERQWLETARVLKRDRDRAMDQLERAQERMWDAEAEAQKWRQAYKDVEPWVPVRCRMAGERVEP
jgi:hypothetical protein